MFDDIQPLTQQQRLAARQKAIKIIETLAIEKPQQSHVLVVAEKSLH